MALYDIDTKLLTLNGARAITNTDVTVCDVLGKHKQTVKVSAGETIFLNTDGWQSGVYIVLMNAPNGMETIRIPVLR